jgi:uncharacterized protein GlcG (DUF336 family)
MSNSTNKKRYASSKSVSPGMVICVFVLVLVTGCIDGGGGGGNDSAGVAAGTAASNCTGTCANASTFLTVADVELIIAQAVEEALVRGIDATIAVSDRVGNVLAVFRMNGANTQIIITSDGAVTGGLEGISVIPDTMVSITKAITASYLSTEGNAFSTRTASQIIQKNFNPGERDQASGPLFGVQFSQLPCSDLSLRSMDGTPGPKRSPLGLSADTGGLPLYKYGTPVGGIGVIADGVYSLDKNIIDFDKDVDELIALAGTFGFTPKPDRRADRITVFGKTLRFSDARFPELLSDPLMAPTFASIDGTVGVLTAVAGYYPGSSVLTGTAFGQPASGVRADILDYDPALNAFVLVDSANTERYRPINGTDAPGGSAANALTAVEVQQILSSALQIANRARAQIRRPLGSPARVTISVVDTHGAILGIVRSQDAPIFGTDVSLQKARTAAFFSGSGRAPISPADQLRNLPDAQYITGALIPNGRIPLGNYATALQNFLDLPGALESFGMPVAFADRSGGNLSRPNYPDGPSAGPPGPLSKPKGEWSVFSTGLQLDLVYNAIIHHVAFVAGLSGTDVGNNCTGDTGFPTFNTSNPVPEIANGIQIFPGSVPVYRNGELVGGIGVSGDGVDQDDMIAFLGLHKASLLLGTGVGNAPAAIRADKLTPRGVRLRYVNCPFAPFNDSSQQDVCNGL